MKDYVTCLCHDPPGSWSSVFSAFLPSGCLAPCHSAVLSLLLLVVQFSWPHAPPLGTPRTLPFLSSAFPDVPGRTGPSFLTLADFRDLLESPCYSGPVDGCLSIFSRLLASCTSGVSAPRWFGVFAFSSWSPPVPSFLRLIRRWKLLSN